MKAITAIPISFVEKPDKMVWFHTKDGHFTTRSAYHLQHVISLSSQGTTSNDRNDKSLCQIYLETGSALPIQTLSLESMQRNHSYFTKPCEEENLVNAICPICLQNTEIVANVLWECETARDVWSQSLRKIQKMTFTRLNFLETWATLITCMNNQELAEMAHTANLI